MKKLILSHVFAGIVIACNPAGSNAGAVSAEKFAQRQLAAASHRWPGITPEQLSAGAIIYRTKCVKCHGNYSLTMFTEERWKYELNRMSTMVKLAPEEEEQLTRYVLSLRDTEIYNRKLSN